MLYFIVNRTAQTGKCAEKWERLHKILIDRGIKYKAFFTEYPGHATVLAGEISQLPGRNKCLVIAGGDGTVNEVLNGIEDFGQVRVGIIPIGSGNDFARGLGLPSDPAEALERILLLADKGEETCCPTDLGMVSADNGQKPRIYGISAGVGMDAIVVKESLTSPIKAILNRIGLGKLTYVLITIYTLFSMKTRDMKVRFYNDRNEPIKEILYRKVIFMAAMNTFAEGGGVPMAPHADPSDGMLSVCTAYGIPKWLTFCCLPLLVMAKHEKLKGFQLTNCDHVRAILAKPVTLHMDGEYCGEVTRVEFRCLPQILRLMK